MTMSIPDYRTARQFLSLRHGRYTMPVLRDDDSTGELEVCACGVYWPCPIGVLLEGYTHMQNLCALAADDVEHQRGVIAHCRDLLTHIRDELTPPNEYDRHEALVEQIDELLQRIPEVRRASANQS
jgi:hypothetical protein